MGYLGLTPTTAQQNYLNIDDISGSFNGTTTSFALQVGSVAPTPFPVTNSCLISVGGVIQEPDDTGTSGFRISGGNIVFSSAPGIGEDFFGLILAGADYLNVGANFPDGTVGTPSITFDSDTNTGIYHPSADELSFVTGGSDRLRVDSNGRLGIGITSPNRQLVVNGGSSEGVIQVTNNTSGTAVANGFELIHFTSGETQLLNRENGAMRFDTNNSEAMRLDSSGRLLVGTTSTSATCRAVVQSESSDAGGSGIFLLSRGNDSPASTQALGQLWFTDSGHGQAASIEGSRDGGTWTSGSSQPSKLTFSTTADGASSVTERLRIAESGAFGLSGANYGTSGQVLTSQGSGSAPQWATVSAGPTLMTEIDCSGVNSALFNGIPDGVNTIRAGFFWIQPPSTAPTVFMAFRVRVGGGGTDVSTSSYVYTSNSGTTITESGGSTSHIVMNGSNVTAAAQRVDGVLTITKIDDPTNNDRYACHWQLGDHLNSRFISHGVGGIFPGGYISAIRFFTPAGANWQNGIINVTYS